MLLFIKYTFCYHNLVIRDCRNKKVLSYAARKISSYGWNFVAAMKLPQIAVAFAIVLWSRNFAMVFDFLQWHFHLQNFAAIENCHNWKFKNNFFLEIRVCDSLSHLNGRIELLAVPSPANCWHEIEGKK